jgi:hypothetical protein
MNHFTASFFDNGCSGAFPNFTLPLPEKKMKQKQSMEGELTARKDKNRRDDGDMIQYRQ